MSLITKRYCPILLLIAGIFVSVNAIAQEEGGEKQTYKRLLNKVTKSKLVYPKGPGEIQISMAPEFNETDTSDQFQLPFGVQYGITDAWQVQLLWYSFIHLNQSPGATTNGIGDLLISTQYSFMNFGNSTFHGAVGFEINFPVGNVNKELSDGFMLYQPYFILAKDFPKLNKMHVFVQPAIEFAQRIRHHSNRLNDAPAAHSIIFNTGFVIPVGKLSFTGAFNLTNDQWNNNGTNNEIYLTPGVSFDLPGTWELTVEAPIGLTGDADNISVVATVVYAFNIFRKKDD